MSAGWFCLIQAIASWRLLFDFIPARPFKYQTVTQTFLLFIVLSLNGLLLTTFTKEPAIVMKKVLASIIWIFTALGNLLSAIILKLVDIALSKWIFAIVYILFLAGPILFIRISLNNPEKDTTVFTNIAFAVLAGISSVTFSWGRTVEKIDPESFKKIVKAGELSLQATIFFLLASAFKYTYISLPHIQEQSMLLNIAKHCIHYISIIFFSLAILNFMLSTLRLCLLLRARVKKN